MLRHLVSPAILSTVLYGCSAVPTADANGNMRTVADGAPFQMDAGDNVRLADGSALRYERILTDSRCPPNVKCVWAGDAILAFVWTPKGAESQSFELHTGLEPRSHDLGQRRLTLQSVAQGGTLATLEVSAP